MILEGVGKCWVTAVESDAIDKCKQFYHTINMRLTRHRLVTGEIKKDLCEVCLKFAKACPSVVEVRE
jgi:hypothetical protein